MKRKKDYSIVTNNNATMDQSSGKTRHLILQHSRADALRDGLLIDASEVASQAGFDIPVALTAAAWREAVSDSPWEDIQDELGRLWDLLDALQYISNESDAEPEMVFFITVYDEKERTQNVYLKSVCGLGDDSGLVITVMLLHEAQEIKKALPWLQSMTNTS